MATFGNCHHDFPRLAKQSGYIFQLYRGRVNWAEIEKLNIDDIIDNKNFQMLEKNLINVINCNLEREYDLKVLDRNFVKLFQLAQLGVDYLSYCELYLDRCVVMLQEQLIALQEEYELLKQENAKRCEEVKKSKKKSRIQSYQCEKCYKVFINEVYLKCHEKRRHRSLKTCKSSKESPKTFVDKCQQTETEEKRENFLLEKQENMKEAKEYDELEIIKKENKIKIENLEKELEDVKSRLKKAESALTRTSEASISSVPPRLSSPNPEPAPNPGSMLYPPIPQWIPSYLLQPRINYFNCTQGYEPLVVENELRENSNVYDLSNSKAVDSKNFFDIELNLNSDSKDNLHGKDSNREEISNSMSTLRENTVLRTNSLRTKNSEKENIDPMEEKVFANSEQPRALPRKIKSLSQTNVEEQMLMQKTPLEEFQMGPGKFRPNLITYSSTPLKEKQEMKLGGGERPEDSSTSFSNKEIISRKAKPKSFLKKIFVKKSPKLQELSKNLRTSLTSLYDSGDGKEARKTKESRNTVIDGLQGELRKLGVDPEWSGIPKNTVHQKLKMLKHRRKLMTKENPMYPVVRKEIEKNVLKRLDEYSNLNKKYVKRESNEQELIDVKSLETSYKTTELTPNVETESESDFNKSEASHDVLHGQKREFEKDVSCSGESTVGKEFDFSVFQVSKERNSKESITKDVLFDVIEDLEIVSDLDSQKSDDVDNSDSHVLEERKSLRNEGENTSDNESKKKLNFFEGKHESTPKSTLRSLSKPEATGLKKKVVFIELSENEESETIESGKKSSTMRPLIGP